LHQEFEERTGHPLPVWKQEAPDCVGQAFALAVTIRMAIQPTDFRSDCLPAYAAVEPIYGGSRVEIGYHLEKEEDQFKNNGTLGIWAAKWLRHYGVLLRKQYGMHDLTEYTGTRSINWGRRTDFMNEGTGVPDVLEQEAKAFPVNHVFDICTYGDARFILHQGFPIAACTSIMFSRQRDEDGFCSRLETKENHCFCIVGVDEQHDRPGLLVCDSRGRDRVTGGQLRHNQPPGSFWITPKDAEAVFNQEESYAIGELTLRCS
jgi:hypothetical protein